MKPFLVGLGTGLVFFILLWGWRQATTVSVKYSSKNRQNISWQVIDKNQNKNKTLPGKIQDAKTTEKSIFVPILTYHYIRVNPDQNDSLGFSLSVTPDDFRLQLAYLKEQGFTSITLDDLSLALDGDKLLPQKPVILTFDDGYRDFYTNAYPALKEYGFKATSYVVVNFLDDKDERYMTSAQVRELDQSGLVTIGSHTLSHANLASASLYNDKREIYESKKRLEKLLGHPVLHFCYPSGKWNETVAALVEAAGYKTATTTQIGSYHYPSERYNLKRLRVSGGTTIESLAEKMSPGYEIK